MLRYHSAFLSNVTRLLVWPHSCFLEMKRRFHASAWDKWQNHWNLFYKGWRQKKEEKKKDQELSSVTLGTQPLCTVYQKDELGKGVRGNSVH